MSKKILAIGVLALISLVGVAMAASAHSARNAGDPLPGWRSQLEVLKRQEARDRAMLDSQAQMIRMWSAQQLKLNAQLEHTEAVARAQQLRIDKMEADNRRSVYENTVATVLNILGMVLGILGGTLLAGAQLTARQERILTLRQLPPLVDIATRNTQYEPVLNFFAILGSITLSAGFILQLIGTLIASPLPVVAMVVVGSIAVAISIWMLWFFLGQTHGQTRGEKLATMQKNVTKNILQPFAGYLFGHGSATCEVRCRKLSVSDAEVWWIAENNPPEHPYLRPPYALHYGHSACLPSCEDYALYYAQPDRYSNHVFHRESAETFVRDVAPKLRTWYKAHREYWASKSNRSDFDSPYEAHLARVEQAFCRS